MSARNRIFPVFVPHAGCPNDCVFCDQRRITGELSPVTAEKLRYLLEALPGGSGYELAFYGGSFTAIPHEERASLLEAVLPFLSDNTIAALRVSTRPDCVSSEALDELERYGVRTIELGAQSMDDGVLLASGRGHSSGDTEAASRLIRSRGFELVLQMMTGLPGSTEELDIFTARRLAALSPDGVRIYPAVVVRDTPLYDMWLRGEYVAHTVDDAVKLCAKILPLFESANIPVIRLGLNPTDELTRGSAVAGAYHPAFGELVLSEAMLQKAREILRGVPARSRVTLGTHPRRVPQLIGHKRRNVKALCAEFGFFDVKVLPAELAEDKIVILDIAKCE